MARYIDADDAIYELKRAFPNDDFGKIIRCISRTPTADVVERKKGKWEVCNILDYAQRPSGRKILRCPFCEYLTDEFRSRVDYYHKLTNYCPNCGARMGAEDGNS